MRRLETAKEKSDKTFRATVTNRAILMGYGENIVRYYMKLFGCSYKTARKKRDDPDTITRGELLRLCSSLSLSDAERAQLLKR